MMFSVLAMLQREVPPPFQKLLDFLDTPAPYSPFSEYLLVLFLLWLLARRSNARKADFGGQAQDVLEEKFKKGEIDKKTYEKFRQELSMRVKKD